MGSLLWSEFRAQVKTHLISAMLCAQVAAVVLSVYWLEDNPGSPGTFLGMTLTLGLVPAAFWLQHFKHHKGVRLVHTLPISRTRLRFTYFLSGIIATWPALITLVITYAIAMQHDPEIRITLAISGYLFGVLMISAALFHKWISKIYGVVVGIALILLVMDRLDLYVSRIVDIISSTIFIAILSLAILIVTYAGARFSASRHSVISG